MHLILIGSSLTMALFLGMLLCAEIGRRIGVARLNRSPEGLAAGAGTVEGAVFALLGLLIAFTFSGAASRFDTRHLIVEETNDIGTAYPRLDLPPVDAQPGLREKFRGYVDARLEVYRKLPDDCGGERGDGQGQSAAGGNLAPIGCRHQSPGRFSRGAD